MKQGWLGGFIRTAAVLALLSLPVPGVAGQSAQDGMKFAQQLADSSLRGEAREYLAEENGIKFYGIKSQYVGDRQLWLRVELGPAAKEELLAKMPAGDGTKEKLGGISASLCRIDPDFASGHYTVIEQVWLNGFNAVIGRWQAPSPGDDWPADFLSQSCETFLRKWMSQKKPAPSPARVE